MELVLWQKADRLLGGEQAVLIIDDTAIPKKGDESVGVAQYCGALGKQANCQSLVSFTLAHDDVPLPLVLRLYLPETWARDAERRKKVGVPDAVGFRPKWRIALDELQRLVDSGVRFGTVLADAGYGVCAEFRQALTQMSVQWAVGISPEQKFHPANAEPECRALHRRARDANVHCPPTLGAAPGNSWLDSIL